MLLGTTNYNVSVLCLASRDVVILDPPPQVWGRDGKKSRCLMYCKQHPSKEGWSW